MKKQTTERGFDIIKFKDRYGEECSLQKSSLATEDAIWFGINRGTPRIMCSDAVKLKIRQVYNDERDNGWCDYIIPDEVFIATRMHLTQEQVKELIPHLQKFVDTGEI